MGTRFLKVSAKKVLLFINHFLIKLYNRQFAYSQGLNPPLNTHSRFRVRIWYQLRYSLFNTLALFVHLQIRCPTPYTRYVQTIVKTSGKICIAYYDSSGDFSTYDNGYRSCMINYLYCFIYSSDFTSSLVSHWYQNQHLLPIATSIVELNWIEMNCIIFSTSPPYRCLIQQNSRGVCVC